MDKQIYLYPEVTAPSGTERALLWSGPDVTGYTANIKLSTIAALSKSVIRLDIFQGIVSSKYDSTQKRVCGKVKFDPTAARYKLSTTSTATLYVNLETTSASNAAYFELFQESGTGSPLSIVTLNTTSLTTVTLTADVSTYFRSNSNAGLFTGREWINVADSMNYANGSGAWIEIQP